MHIYKYTYSIHIMILQVKMCKNILILQIVCYN